MAVPTRASSRLHGLPFSFSFSNYVFQPITYAFRPLIVAVKVLNSSTANIDAFHKEAQIMAYDTSFPCCYCSYQLHSTHSNEILCV